MRLFRFFSPSSLFSLPLYSLCPCIHHHPLRFARSIFYLLFFFSITLLSSLILFILQMFRRSLTFDTHFSPHFRRSTSFFFIFLIHLTFFSSRYSSLSLHLQSFRQKMPRVCLPRLCKLLHDAGDFLDEDGGWWFFHVDSLVCLGGLPCLVDEDTVVRAHARVNHANVGADNGDLFHRRVVNQRRYCFLFRRNYNSVRSYLVVREGRSGLVIGYEI